MSLNISDDQHMKAQRSHISRPNTAVGHIVELQFAITTFFRPFAGLEKDGDGQEVAKGVCLWETGRRDLDVEHDFIAGQPAMGRANLRIILE